MENQLLQTSKISAKQFCRLPLIWFLALLLSPLAIYPQELASRSEIIERPQKLENQKIVDHSLSTILKEIGDKYDVQFAYDSKLIDKMTIRDFEIEAGQKVDDVLEKVISQTNLSFERVKKNQYVIFQNQQEKVDRLKEIQGYKPGGSSSLESFTNNEMIDPNVAFAFGNQVQDKTITGKIVDERANALPGVNVLVKGTNTGTVSDSEGDYSLTVTDDTEVLVFSFIGYETQEVNIENRSVINISMNPDITQLGEVVVTALGIEKEQKTLGYATSKVNPDEFTVNRSPVFMDALQGKVPGVNITKLGSGPQGSSKIRIRGVSSFGGNNSPLIVVNGVPIDNTNFGVRGESSEVGSNRTSDSGDGLSGINPDDITSMSVLKGAAASALYGARAKDGVIMITTRNRTEGEGLQVEWNSNFTHDSPLDYTDYQYEYGQGEGGVRPNAPGPTSGVWSFGEKMEPGMTQILFDGLEVPYTPQPNKVKDYYDNGHTWSNTLRVSSGGENGGFSLSIGNLNNKTILPGSKYDRQTVNLGFTQKISKLTVSGNMNYAHEDRTNPPNIAEQDFSPVVIYTLATSMPLKVLEENAFDENGDEVSYSRFTNRTNPYFALSRFENNIKDRVYGNITARYDLLDWLYVQGRIGQDYYTRDVEYNLPTGSQRQSSPPAGFVNGQYVRDVRRVREVNADFLVGANRTFGDFGVNLTVGGNQMYRRFDINTELGENFFTRNLYTIGNASKVTPNYTLSERQVNSLYGAAEVSFRDYLYLNATVRNDWFSTLSSANRSILYPSVTGSFVFSQAIANLPNWISFGKIRLAYAEVGSDTDVQPYSNNLFYGISAQQFPDPAGTPQPVGNINGVVVPNANLKPMEVREKEIGLEMTLFDNLRFEISYYNKLSSNQILQAQISDASGFQNQLINVGESRNKGLELFASYSPIKSNKFEWNISANATNNTSEVLSLGDDVDGTFITVGGAEFHGELRQVVGQPMAQLYGWGYLRDDQGRQVFDPNSGRPMRSDEQLNFGSALPTWWGGFGNTFTYGKLSLYFLIDFKLGHNMISGTHTNAYRHGLDKATLVGRDVGFVVGEGVNPDGSVNTVQSPIQPFYETIRSFRMSEQSVFNAGSWQLRQMSLGYDLTDLIPENKYVKGVQLNIIANNVAVIKKWVPHIHPDQNGIIDDNRVGLEATGLPVTRSIGFNLNFKF